MKSYFSIISMGRSGSTLLERLLASHPHITSLGEVVSKDGPYARCENEPIKDFIEKELFASYTGVCGFKMPFDHIVSYPDIFGAFKDLSFKLILLRRMNKLDQFISVKFAQATGVWASNATYGDKQISIDANELMEFFISSEYADAVLHQMSKRYRVFNVFYEDIFSKDMHGEMLDFLEVDRFPLTTDTVRSRSMRREDSVSNYTEVANIFRRTKWRSFFGE